MTTYQLRAAQPLRWLGGKIDIRVEIDTGLVGAFGLWDSAQWDVDLWGSRDPAWTDITEFSETINTNQGTQTWGSRFEAGSMSILVSNTDGRFTPDSGVDPFHLPFRPGRRIRVVALPDPDATGQPDEKKALFTGYIDSTVDAFDEGGYLITTTLNCLDYMALWGQHNPTALEDATGVQSTDERVHAALDRMGWPMEGRDIQEGVHTMQTSHLAQSTLEECQRAADAEGGQFFCSFDGKATFKARDWLDTDSRSINIQGWLGYSQTEIDLAAPVVDNTAMIEAFTPNWDRARVVNLVSFARVGSTMQTVEDEDSQAIYDVRSYQRTDLENNSDAEVMFLAERYLERYKSDRLRVASITIGAVDDPDNADRNRMMWDTQFGDLLAVTVRTPYGWDITKGVKVAGISHAIDANSWTVTFKLDDVGAGELPPPVLNRVQTVVPVRISFQNTLGQVGETVEELTTSLPLTIGMDGELAFIVRPWQSVQTSLPLIIAGEDEVVSLPNLISTSLPVTVGGGAELSEIVLNRVDLMAALGPEAWWKMANAGALDTTDYGTGTHTASFVNGPTRSSIAAPLGPSDHYVRFNSITQSQYMGCGDRASLQLRQNMSIEVWVQSGTTGSLGGATDAAIRHVIGMRVSSPSSQYLYAIKFQPSTATFSFYPGTGSNAHATGITIPGIRGQWTHIVYTVEWTPTGRIITGYKNGVLIGSQTVTFKPTSQDYILNAAWMLGGTASDYFIGSLSEAAIFSKVLNAAEVEALYEARY